MAGQYFYDPRPFYGQNGSNGLMPMDELFYGPYEQVPYWMDQRMAPVSAFDDYYPGHKQMAMGRPPLPQLQQYAYKRPESRDDIGVDMYRRSPYNFQGVAAPMSYGGQQLRQAQDDTWVHAMTPNGYGQQHGNMTRNGNGKDQFQVPVGYNMPNGNMNGSRGMEMPMNNGHMNNKGNNMSNMGNMGNMGNNGNNGNNGSLGNKQMSVSSNQFAGNKSNGFGNGGNGGNAYGNGNKGYNGYENAKSSSQGGKSMNSMQGGNTKQRYSQDDSSSDDSDDEYGNSNKNGVKWATKNSVKHGNGHHNSSQKTGSKGNNYGYDSISSKHMSSKKSGGYGGKSGGSHGSTQSKISKLLGFGGDSSSSDSEDERYGLSRKSSKGGSKMSSHGSHGSYGNHGSFQNHSHGQQLGKQTLYTYSGQSKGVELKVPICCDNCEKKVKECFEYMDGVENVLCDQWNRKVTVYGNVKPENVLRRVRRVKKTAELWQQAKLQQQLRAY
ncbi:hypothetical protein KC19_11G064600 [Ceratodon purpureus]|uniref:HMA domain-containing protein n=1 Tax=Ceratodon purpureus TaxID=3225 RepID=A0A8T0GBM9_CERPU|nr:hypothetical protein KC19_11G064600 [Ceratodon purpureus]